MPTPCSASREFWRPSWVVGVKADDQVIAAIRGGDEMRFKTACEVILIGGDQDI